MANCNKQSMGPLYCKKRLQNSIRGSSTSIRGTHLLPTNAKSSVGRRNKQSSPKKGSGGNLPGISRVLLKSFSCPKKEWKTKTHYRPFHSKQAYFHTKFQNGNTEESKKCYSKARLGYFVRPDRCVSSRSSPQKVTQISQVYSRRPNLPMESSSVWSLDKPFCVHCFNERDRYVSQNASNLPFPISGRLAVQKPKSVNSTGTQTFHYSANFFLRPDHQQGEIRPDPIPNLCFHRDGIPNSSQHSQSTSRQSSEYYTVSAPVFSENDSLSQTIPISLGTIECSSRFCNARQAASQTITDVTFSSVETSYSPTITSHHNFSKPSTSSLLVEQSNSFSRRGPNQKTTPFSSNLHRCQSSGLGCSPGTGRTVTSWSLDKRTITTPHQSFRNDGHFIDSETGQCSSTQFNCSDIHRQYYCGGLPEQTRGDTLTRSLPGSLEHPSLVSSKQNRTCYKTYSWPVQHPGRPTVENFETYCDRMVSQPIYSQCNFSNDYNSQHRPFCDTPKSQITNVRVTNPGSKGSCNRCTNDELEFHTCLCIPSISSDTSCSQQNQIIPMSNSLDSTILAKQTVVSRPSKSVNFTTNISSSNSQPTTTITRKISTSKPTATETTRLGIIKRSITDQKFSRQVAEHISKARRPSTRKVYDAKSQCFVDWANKREVNPVKASPYVVADFLTYLFSDKKCQVSTIKGYRSTISNTLKFSSRNNIGSHPVISELIKSFEIQRPVSRSLAPKWDLAFVLSCLCKAPFEPLHEASLIHLSMKTAFLLTMATARRVSEIHAFSIDKNLFRFSHVDGSLTVRTQSGFLAKNQLPSKAPDSIHIPKLSNTCKSKDFNSLLCPIRAIKIYLKRTKSLRGSRTRLFIPTKGDHDIKKSTISNWVKFTIKLAYKSISQRQIKLLKIKAHELRALSASWAYFNSIPLNEVLQAAVWSSSSTFAKFYLRDFKEQTTNLQNLGPLVTAQKVVGGAPSLRPNMSKLLRWIGHPQEYAGLL